MASSGDGAVVNLKMAAAEAAAIKFSQDEIDKIEEVLFPAQMAELLIEPDIKTFAQGQELRIRSVMDRPDVSVPRIVKSLETDEGMTYPVYRYFAGGEPISDDGQCSEEAQILTDDFDEFMPCVLLLLKEYVGGVTRDLTAREDQDARIRQSEENAAARRAGMHLVKNN